MQITNLIVIWIPLSTWKNVFKKSKILLQYYWKVHKKKKFEENMNSLTFIGNLKVSKQLSKTLEAFIFINSLDPLQISTFILTIVIHTTIV